MNEKLIRLKKLVEENTHRKEAHFLLAETYVKNKLFKEAKESYMQAISIDSRFLKAYTGLGEVLLSNNNTEEANKIFDMAAANFERDSDCIYVIAKIYKKYNQLDKALYFFRKSHSIQNIDPRIYKEIGDILALKRDYNKAQQHFKKALDLSPKDISLYVKLALIFQAEENHKKAIETLHEGLKIEPNNAEIHYILGQLYFELKMDNELLREIELLKEIDPDKANELEVQNA